MNKMFGQLAAQETLSSETSASGRTPKGILKREESVPHHTRNWLSPREVVTDIPEVCLSPFILNSLLVTSHVASLQDRHALLLTHVALHDCSFLAAAWQGLVETQIHKIARENGAIRKFHGGREAGAERIVSPQQMQHPQVWADTVGGGESSNLHQVQLSCASIWQKRPLNKCLIDIYAHHLAVGIIRYGPY